MTNTYNTNNIFYKILNKEVKSDIISENEYAIAIHDIAPKATIHILIITKGLYTSYPDFINKANKDEIYGVLCFIDEICKKFKISSSGYRLITNHGKDSCQEVPHFHIHILGGEKLSS